ncbi:hypothetical protein [Nocardia cyriacigeorgica]|uniref:hypothetical protein n=1 Tax=Nocardia cyriacigeorgica TaxID=135487 RepID=UPI0013D719C5|nr:hypothetical protein [Nocardia cyriacigeorgica]NEW28397.1 hypothetical protein [Nocardia cyriacigeorgica]
MGITEFAPGDVGYFPHGPFSGICGVVDARGARMRIEFSEGTVHREGGVLRERRHHMTVAFDEVELV